MGTLINNYLYFYNILYYNLISTLWAKTKIQKKVQKRKKKKSNHTMALMKKKIIPTNTLQESNWNKNSKIESHKFKEIRRLLLLLFIKYMDNKKNLMMNKINKSKRFNRNIGPKLKKFWIRLEQLLLENQHKIL